MDEPEIPLVNNTYLLEKFPGKGGWTYTILPEIPPDKKAHFGIVRVKGFIDSYELKKYNLMPLGDGRLFLPVKAEIRKKIGKQEGDWVQVTLYRDASPTEIPEELLECFKLEPGALDSFLSYSAGEQQSIIDWIYSAKTDETKVERIAKTLGRIVSRKS